MKRHLTLFAILLMFISCNSSKKMIDNTAVKDFDIDRYLGTWYEIARYDHKFERDMVGVTATYTIRNDGKIKVENVGFKNTLDGKKSTAIGKAKIPNKKYPAKLKVSFFWFFYADYFVMELDPDYQWAIVGSSSDDYLWILARTPQIEESLYQMLLQKISDRGYATDKLIKVVQAEP